MPRKKKANLTVIDGGKRPYRRPARYETFEYRPEGFPVLGDGEVHVIRDGEVLAVAEDQVFEGDELCAALWIKCQTNLSWNEIRTLEADEGMTFEQAFPLVAPYIIDWNAEALNLETGEYEPAPPPAEAGGEIMRVLDRAESYWAIQKVRNGYLGGDLQKKESPTPKPSASPGPNESAETPT